jgi:hypothetical protein
VRDDFALTISQVGHRLCGGYETTAQLGNHVDDGDLSKWTFRPITGHTFRVHFQLSGSAGEAVVGLAGNRMHWRVLTEHQDPQSAAPTWSFSPPETATLVRLPAGRTRHPPAC